MQKTLIECTRHGTKHWVRVIGRATMPDAPKIREALETTSANTTSVWLDLSQTTHLDSTVMGCLVGVAKRRDGAGPDFVLNAPSEGSLKALRQLKLDKLLRIEHDTAPADGWLAVTEPVTSREQLANMVASSHQELAEANPDDPQLARIAKSFRNATRPQADDSQ